MRVTREQVLAFRVARQGLATRDDGVAMADAAVVPASDFVRGTAMVALAARSSEVTRERYDAAVDAGDLVVGFTLRGALHAVAPADVALFGPALLSDEDGELAEQLGQQMRRLLSPTGLRAGDALEEVAEAMRDALAGGVALTKDELHEALRARVRAELMPWCEGCGSHHVAPMLWRYACCAAGVRCDAARRFLLEPRAGSADPLDAVRRFLRAYAPATTRGLAAWAGLHRAHAGRLWEALSAELVAVEVEGRDGPPAFALADDADALAAPPRAEGLRLLPSRDPYLTHPDRTWLTPDADLRKRLHRPTAGPGAILQDGALAALSRVRVNGKRLELTVEPVGAVPLDPAALDAEAARLAELRGAAEARISMGS